ncbi:hypothetical protein D3C73_1329840 [compost metagenome]
MNGHAQTIGNRAHHINFTTGERFVIRFVEGGGWGIRVGARHNVTGLFDGFRQAVVQRRIGAGFHGGTEGHIAFGGETAGQRCQCSGGQQQGQSGAFNGDFHDVPLRIKPI